MMKRFFLILILLFSYKTYSCSCATVPLLKNIANSDFIATAKILDIQPDEENSEYHNIQIEIIDLYKGNQIKKLKIWSVLNSSCAFYTPKGSKWLIYASKNKNGNLSFNFCSESKQLDKKFNSKLYPNAEKSYKRSIQMQLDILKSLKINNIKVPYDTNSISTIFEGKCLKKFYDIHLEGNKIAFFELKIDYNLTLFEVKKLKGFDNEVINIQLQKCIKKNTKIYSRKNKSELPKETNKIIAFYFYPATENKKSFIWYLN